MILYMLRHGEAESQAATDSARKLTAVGEQEVVSVAMQFIENKLKVDRCISSTYARARRTAELFVEQVSPGLVIESSDLLTPEIRASQLMSLLSNAKEEHILLVSHNPLLSELNALLTEGDISQMHILSTSELVAINIDIIGLGMGSTILRFLPDENLITN